ncbi:MAG: DUF3857 domain-containing protein [Bacteroidia bacterium]
MKNHLIWQVITLAGFTIPFHPAFAQPAKIDLNEIKQELEMTSYEADPDAGAVILMDYGEAYIEPGGGDFQLKSTKYFRAKVFKESAFDLAEVEINYLDRESIEKIGNVRAATYYMEGNKVKSYEISKKDITDTDIGDGWRSIKFTLPQLKEGSVFEYSYQITSGYISRIKPWYFQHYYPVVHSEYRTRIPEWYQFLPLLKGSLALTDRKSSSFSRSVTFTDFDRGSSGLRDYRTGNSQSQTVQYRGEDVYYIMKNVPGFVREPYITTVSDYLSSLQFQLQTIHYPQQPPKPILGSWEQLAREYMQDESFGLRLNDNRIRRLVKDLPLEGKTQAEQTELIYNFVRSSMKWNGEFQTIAQNPLHTAFERKEGSSGEINLILLDMLKEAGINAQPVILSTRSHGKIQQIFPIYSQFNHVIVVARVESGPILLDAIDDFMPLGMLPATDLNETGFILSENSPAWVDVNPNHNQETTWMVNMRLDEEGTLDGSLSHTANGYAAADARFSLSELNKDEEEFVKNHITDEWSEVEYSEVKTTAADNPAKPFEVSCHITGTDFVNVAGDFIYVQPLLSVAQKENPFKLTERTYPVDFAIPIHEKYFLNLLIPEGFKIEELPKATKVVLPDNGATFFYQAKEIGSNQIQLVSDIVIAQTVFRPDEYEYIKLFFDHIVTKHSEQIVLKKIE